jgi:hypothetical protein
MVYINGLGQIRVGVRPWVDSGIDPSANLFFAASGLSDTTQRNAVNTLVKDLKRFGLWSKIKAFYPFVGGTADSHKWNLVDPRDTDSAYRLTFSGGWTHTSMGIKTNGSNTSANTFLNLRTVFGATSSQHNIGIYINENPIQSFSVRGFRNDIGASDASSNVIDAWVNNASQMFFRNISSDNWFTYLTSPSDVSGLNEFKRYKDNYYTWTKDGYEVQGTRNVTVTTRYNPNSNVYIGSSSSTNRYSTAYISEPLDSLQTFLIYIAVQRYNSTLNRQVGTAISPVVISTVQSTQTIVTSGMKVNLDARTLTKPTEGALGTSGNWYWGVTPGNYFRNNDVWIDQSGNGNNGTFWANTLYENRSAEYFIDDFGVAEIRLRDHDNTSPLPKLYQYGSNGDAVTTAYKGSDTGTYTFGGWVKMNSRHNYFSINRGEDSQWGGGAWSIQLTGSGGGKLGIGLVTSGGAIQGTAVAATTFKQNVWYNIYCVWKPSSYIKYYINGVLQVTNAMTHTTLRTPNGSYGWLLNASKVGQYHYRGIFGAFHVYDRELTTAEIKQNFDSDKDRYNVTYVEDSDAHAFVTAAGITSTTQANAINTLVTALKAAGIWTKMKAIYPFVGGTAESHKFNLKDPRDADAAFRLTFSGGMTHSSTGVLFGGVNGYADTFFRPGSNYDNTTWNAHMSFYSRSNVEAPTTNWLSGGFGVDSDYAAAAYFVLIVNRKGTRTIDGRLIGTQWASYTSALDDSRGLFMINKQSEALLKLTKNTTLLAQNTTSSWSVNKPGDKLYLGAVNGSQSYSGLNYDNKEYAFATIGSGLTDAEATAFYNAVQAYQTALGRAV